MDADKDSLSKYEAAQLYNAYMNQEGLFDPFKQEREASYPKFYGQRVKADDFFLIEIFDRMSDDDGFITIDFLRNNWQMSKRDIKKVMDLYDLNGDNKLDIDEYAAYYTDMSYGKPYDYTVPTEELLAAAEYILEDWEDGFMNPSSTRREKLANVYFTLQHIFELDLNNGNDIWAEKDG